MGLSISLRELIKLDNNTNISFNSDINCYVDINKLKQ